jgi:hypothetical protein
MLPGEGILRVFIRFLTHYVRGGGQRNSARCRPVKILEGKLALNTP